MADSPRKLLADGYAESYKKYMESKPAVQDMEIVDALKDDDNKHRTNPLSLIARGYAKIQKD
jgi:hypothetical protein